MIRKLLQGVFSLFLFLFFGQKVLALERTNSLNSIQNDRINTLPTSTPTPAALIETRAPVRILPSSTPTPTQARYIINRVSSIPTLSPTSTPALIPTLTLTPVPSSNIIQFRKIEKKETLEAVLANSPVTFKKEDGFTRLSFDVDQKKVDLPIRADFVVKEGKLILLNERQELPLKFSPRSFYAILESVLGKSKSELGSIDLKIDRGEPYYFVKIKENLKLFGFIPFRSETLLKVNARTNKPDLIDTGLLGKLVVHANFTNLFAAGPDFELKNVRFEPLSYRAGDKVVIRADLVNTGTVEAYSGVGNHVKNWLYDKDKPIYGTDEQVIYSLAPGETQKMSYVWDNVVCSEPLSIIFDTDRVLKETGQKTVWYGASTCAPDHGPDLTVSQIKFEGLYYGGKNPGVSNKVSYVISNIGDKISEPVKALAKAGNAQFLSIISIPAINPYGYFSGNFNFTPTICDPVDINVDTQGILKGKETNRDNNDVFEDKQVTDWCNNYPQLQFDRVYWMANGYSFGKSKYPNGSQLKFEVDLGNLSWDGTVGCAALVKIRVDVNGQFYTDVPVGNVGSCANGGTYSQVDNAHMFKTVNFSIGPACGADVKFTIDPDHINPEIDRSDNIWTHKVECE